MNKIYSENLKATVDEVEYTWSGGLGNVITSMERNIKQGEVRVIGDIIFHAYRVYKISVFSRTLQVNWCPFGLPEINDNVQYFQWIRSFKAKLFNINEL